MNVVLIHFCTSIPPIWAVSFCDRVLLWRKQVVRLFYISLTCLGHFPLVMLILKIGLPPFKCILPEGCCNFTALWILKTWFISLFDVDYASWLFSTTYKYKVLLLTESLSPRLSLSFFFIYDSNHSNYHC